MSKVIIFGIILVLSGCDNTSADTVKLTPQQEKELQTFIHKAKAEQIFVQGGNLLDGGFLLNNA